jgi:hypothetical protein
MPAETGGWIFTYPDETRVTDATDNAAIDRISQLREEGTTIVKHDATGSSIVSCWRFEDEKWKRLKNDRLEIFLAGEDPSA